MSLRTLLAAALTVPIILMPHAAFAQTPGPWQFQGMLYLYLPTIGGTTTFPQSAAGSEVSVSPDKILQNLNGVFMGSLEANNGRWGAFTDLVYMDVGGTKTGTRDFSVGHAGLPAAANADVTMNLTGNVWTLGGSYRLLTTPRAKMELLAGARLLDLKQTTSWSLNGNIGGLPLPAHAGNLSTATSNWDAIVGFKGRVAVGEETKWFVPYYLDVGTGESDRTWQAVAGLGYSFGWGDVLAEWRHIDYKLQSGKPIESLNFSGPGLAAAFHW